MYPSWAGAVAPADSDPPVPRKIQLLKGASDHTTAFLTIPASSSAEMDPLDGNDTDDSMDHHHHNPTGDEEADDTVVWPEWTKITDALHRANETFLLALSLRAARYPYHVICGIALLSFGLLATGYKTNFHINVKEGEIYAPFGSTARHHYEWYEHESGLAEDTRGAALMIHSHGDNVLGMAGMERVWEALDTVRNTTGYHDICDDGAYWDGYKEEFTCRIVSTTRFWYHDQELYEGQVRTEEDLVQQLSATKYPGGTPVDSQYVMGKLERNGENNTITYVPTFFVYILLTDKGEQTLEFELAILEKLANLQAKWDGDASNPFRLDYITARSSSDEFERAIQEDMTLLPVIFFVMSGFTCIVFFRKDLVQSRCLLGVGSVVTILLSLSTGFGILFICGVPFTSMTQLLPFVVFGVGLDDTFIITGAYLRSDSSLCPEDRIRLAIMEAGPSITVTTITTACAFLLGLTSSVPAIFWLCLYAFPTIIIDYIYQITFFVAILVLDERRIKDQRYDVFVWCKRSAGNNAEESNKGAEHPSAHFADRVMGWYARLLLQPISKAVVVTFFSALFGYCLYRATLLKQEIEVRSLFADDSYMIPAYDVIDKYQERSIYFYIIFRNEDQGDPLIQQQMISFVEEIQELPALGAPPPLCWVRDLQELKKTEYFGVVEDLDFEEQIQFAMDIPAFKEAYGDDFVIDEATGNITTSKCTILANNSHLLESVNNRIGYLNSQLAVTRAQEINKGKPVGQESFFTYENVYTVWEFYNVAISELILTTLMGIAAVGVITVIFVPHWTAAVFVVPMVMVVYVDLLGVMQIVGLHINAVTFVCLVISIGLIVDFLLHIMLRYVESSSPYRDDRVKETLQTMGSSILLGGLSTFLGTALLAFSTSMIMRTVFKSLCSMVVLSVSHGLIVLPVLLSLFGPIPRSIPSKESLKKGPDLPERCASPVSLSEASLGLSQIETEVEC